MKTLNENFSQPPGAKGVKGGVHSVNVPSQRLECVAREVVAVGEEGVFW